MTRRHHRTLLVIATVVAMLVAPINFAHAVLRDMIIVGTSIEFGTGLAAGQSWPSRLQARTPGWTITDMSKPGGAYTATDETGDDIRAHVDAAIALDPDLLIIGGPVNDLVRLNDITPLREAVFEAVNAATTAGVPVLVMGIFPFTDCANCAFQAGWWPNLESRRTTYNNWAKAMYGQRYVDLSWWLKETATSRGDSRWFRDGLHPYRVGAALIAEAFPTDKLELT